MTAAERVLWDALRDQRLGGLKFRRQHTAGQYYLDFYCPSRLLAVEVDGDVHDEQVEYDANRTAYHNSIGIRVIRFHNEQVLNHLNAVLEEIALAALNPPPPLPREGRVPPGWREEG
jgi:very-short-patch-repair endonuclease